MYLLVDTETTGLDPATCRVWEVGMVVVNNKWEHVADLSLRMYDDEIVKQLTDNKEVLPNLPPLEDILKDALMVNDALALITAFVADTKPLAIFAYNAKFDEGFVKAMVTNNFFSLTAGGHALNTLPWYCLMEGIPSNYNYKCWRLGHLALDYGIAVDPAKLHGAYEDIELTRQIAIKSGHDVESVIRFINEPWHILRAITEKPWIDGGKGVALAKQLGFSWEKAKGMEKPVPKTWVKRVKESALAQEQNVIKNSLQYTVMKEEL